MNTNSENYEKLLEVLRSINDTLGDIVAGLHDLRSTFREMAETLDDSEVQEKE